MSHNIETYIGRESAWHNLGTVTGRYMTWNEILQHGGLDFSVFKSQLHDGLGRPVQSWGTFRWNAADRANGDKAAATFLGNVGENYEVIQHSKSFDMLDALVAAQDGAHYETAGVLGHGEVVWGLIDLKHVSKVRGVDEHRNYLLAVTSHDGSYSHLYKVCDKRVVCNNTLNVALSERTQAMFRIKHTKSAQERLVTAKTALQSVMSELGSVEEKLNMLASRRITRENMESILDRLFPKTKKEDEINSSTRRENVLANVLSLYESNDGNAYPEFRGTAYNLLNAMTEYTDHYRTTRNGQRAESAMFGSGERLKRLALDTIVAEVAKEPSWWPQPEYAIVRQ